MLFLHAPDGFAEPRGNQRPDTSQRRLTVAVQMYCGLLSSPLLVQTFVTSVLVMPLTHILLTCSVACSTATILAVPLSGAVAVPMPETQA